MTSAAARPTRHLTRRAAMAGLALLLAPFDRSAEAEVGAGTSDWSVSEHARVRLIDAGPAPDGQRRLVGIQVELDPGYLTYWRSPGEAGLPPTIAFTGSAGFKSATVLFPAPGRYSEGGTEAIGYKDGVVFPVLVMPQDGTKPVGLKLALDFGICERLCLPAKAIASLTLDGDGTALEADLVRDALARVPVPASIGGSGTIAITAIDGQAGDPTLTVRARAEGGDVPLLFVEAPDPWFAQVGEGLWSNDGSLRYTLRVTGKPADPAPLPLRLTLVGADAAVEVPVTLDAPPPKP